MRLHELDRAKGMAILLVVLGHLVARDNPVGVTWYEPLRIAIYLFHMPLFMFLSGYLAFRMGTARVDLALWPRLVRRRAVRLLVPFLAFGLGTLLVKVVAAQVAPVDNLPTGFWVGLRDLLWDTSRSPATAVWFVFVLFVYSVITPLVLALPRGRLWLVLLAGVLYVLPVGPPFYLDRICTFFVFFVAGGLAAEAGRGWLRRIDAAWPFALAALAAVAVPVALGWIPFDWRVALWHFPYKWALLLAGLLSLPAIHGLARAMGRSAALEFLGRESFVIYLFNTLFIGATKAVLLTVLAWNATGFPIMAVALMAAGTFGPIALKGLVLRRIPVLARMTG
ncbi:Acyltransferase family protein [Rhodovastum atsumiense]|uniref:acyltransferase family protein n=1 Tax=Rhodovastum atsumiense TaxID=504468 RepID=UPI00139F2B47|nr:acyltransferase family protein [Rhodovastum atsumiense]CAH2604438.1 Acyltransferase family protein [Rhodovastum atsumiense]